MQTLVFRVNGDAIGKGEHLMSPRSQAIEQGKTDESFTMGFVVGQALRGPMHKD
jgi:hypothetical protein